ncbi:MAG: hypothetical protein AAFQ98_20960 [Bacteroidota bacterium]
MKQVLEESGIEIENGDYARIARLLTQSGDFGHGADYVQKVCHGKLPNVRVFDYCLEYFREKGRMYRQLGYWVSTERIRQARMASTCDQER